MTAEKTQQVTKI